MHRRQVLQLGGLAGLAAMLPPAARAATGWQKLWDGRSLKGWTRLGEAKWTIADGILACSEGPISYLVSDAEFGDFALRAEFWVSEDANSGIFIRCTNPADVTPTNSYEVNIFDRRPDPTYATGAIVGVAKVVDMPKAGGRWNLMEITAKGDRLSVTLNGRRTVDNVQDAAHARGRITLQYGAGTVKFRTVEVQAL
ncbi:3-keto-disaccharide hydrolase [Sandarakinorhabdus rubra]|uniref:3-keto-disaccharide hydrolase n=1 Tax=Sandarakinorhabdus rubra TaxID=2672568 RepID=UPI0013DBB242|nr:DUF1080 domain-containing protein [Sandarakinorhabdus rubra]